MENNTEDRRRKAVSLLLASLISEEPPQNKPKTKKKFWVHPYLQKRNVDGAFVTVFEAICEVDDPLLFKKYLRLTSSQLEELLEVVGPTIQKEHFIREPIPAKMRLVITLRFLATGESQTSLAIAYKCSASVVHNILMETMASITKEMRPKVFPVLDTNQFVNIAHGFESRWNFPNCVGALDGKHIMIQAPAHSGSEFFNYKKHYSIVLMAMCDSNYSFTMCDVGAAGRQSDGGVFQNSEFGKQFSSNTLPLPPSRDVASDLANAPYVIVADDAFPLAPNMLKPYCRRNLSFEERIFNYRLSRARRVIENTFGILVAKWRVFRCPINASLPLTELIVQSSVCLHNWLRNHNGSRFIDHGLVDIDEEGQITRGSWRSLENNMLPLRPNIGNSSNAAKSVRNDFAKYFVGSGAVSWQNSKA